MKQLLKKFGTLLMIGVLFVSTILSACDKKKAEEDPFEWAKETPKTADIGDELNFNDYITKEDGATYTLYASYDSTEKEKQSSLVYAFTKAADYTFEIERTKNEKTASISCEISVLPNAPEFSTTKVVTAEVGGTLTLANILNGSQIVVTPSDLQESIAFTTVDVTYATVNVEDEDAATTASESLAGKTSYTFAKEGVYKFNVKATNKGGEATAQITVNAYDATKYSAQVETEYEAEQKLLTWEEVTGATAYRVWVGNDAQTVTSAQLDLNSKADGEYTVKIVPVYTNVYYPSAILTETVYVGAVKTPLTLTREVNTVKWTARPFATSYTVTENGDSTTYETTDELAHTIKNTYSTDEQVTVTVVANFDDNTTTEVATMNISYGTVTLNAMKPTDGSTYSNNLFKPTTGIQFVEFDGFTPASGNKVPPTYFLVEFTGRNAPNFAMGAQKGFSELICPSDSVGTEDPTYRAEWSKAGITLWNSKPGSSIELYVMRGFSGNAGNVDLSLSSSWKRGGGDASKFGMANYEPNQKYVLLIGGELWTGDDIDGWTNPGTALHLVAKLFTVDENSTLTLKESLDGVIASKGHALTATSTKAVIYGNVISNSDQAQEDPTIDPASITFKYWKPAGSIEALVNGMNDSSAYKAQLKTLLSIS